MGTWLTLTTCAATLRPLSASIVTVAIWPSFTLPISDSLNATTSCSDSRSLRTANADEPEDEPWPELEEAAADDEPPADDFTPPAPPVDEPPLDELPVLAAAFVVPVPETVSPTSPESVTIVPLVGAYSFVFCTACSALCTASLSLFTAARADARFASRVAALCLVLDELAPWLLAGVVEELDSVPFAARVEPPACVPAEGLVEDLVVLVGVVDAGAVLVGAFDAGALAAAVRAPALGCASSVRRVCDGAG